MRIVGGRARGITLSSVRGSGLRPTTDRVRGAIFSMLEARQTLMEARGLDLYAGTGAIGIEALSRGASQVDFVEQSPKLCAVIRKNVSRAGFDTQAEVLAMPVARALETLTGPYDLVFMDPPYDESESLREVIRTLLDAGMMAPGGMLVIEQASRDRHDFSGAGLHSVQEKRYGDTAVSLYSVGEEGERA